jgi:hypothetical protein
MAIHDIIRRARPSGPPAAALAIALMLAPGCGGESGPPRLPVSGRVTLDGQPLSTGAVTLIPTGDGPAVGGTIRGGAFAVGRSEGPSPGTYKVEITSVRPTGRRVTSPDDPTARIEEERDIIPVRYNAETRLEAEVKPDGPNAFQFELSSREDRARGRRVAGRGARGRNRSLGSRVE